MSNRRNFIRKGVLGAISLPLIAPLKESSYTLSRLKQTALQSDKEYWDLIRKQFPLKEGQTYFNNGTMGPSSGYVLNKIMDHMLYYNVHGAEIDYKNGSGPELLSGYFPYEELRKKIAEIINSEFDEIALTQNATFGMNYVGNGLSLNKGDELLNTNQEHGGGFGVWQLLAKRKGCTYKQAIMPEPANEPQEIIDAIFKEVTSKTKVIAIPHIVSVYGTIMPVKEICAEAKKRGIFTILDGAQTVGQIKVDVKDIGCDAYYSSLHKWLLAPAGSGILYVRKEMMPKIWSTIASYNWDKQDDHGFRLMQNGTGNPALVAGLDAAVDFYNSIGQDKWIGRVKALGDYLRAGLQEIEKVTIHSSLHPEMCAGITTYSFEGITGPELQKTLWEKERLQPRSVGEKLLRHSVHIYNNEEEIEKTFKVLKSI